MNRSLQNRADQFWAKECFTGSLRTRHIQALNKQEMPIAAQTGQERDQSKGLV